MGKTLFFDIDFSNSFFKKKKKNFRKFFLKNLGSNSFLDDWKILKEKEIKFELYFKIYKNNGHNKNSKTLWLLKRLFQKQLPNIPKTYITRILYEKNHQSLVLKRYKNKKSQIVGGCSFRLFKRQQLVELVFFSIETKKQTRGYGSFLILFLKDYSRFLGFKYIITCADNNAVNFFFNQGFSPIITLPTFFWAGFLKDYEDVVLMEFTVHNKLNFVNTSYMSIFFGNSCVISSSSKIRNEFEFTGLRETAKSKNKVFFFSKKITEYKKSRKFHEEIEIFFNALKSKNFIFPFLEPIKEDCFFDKNIFKKIYNGMDLRTIEEKIRFNFYASWNLFIKDLNGIVKNYQLYNGEKHLISENLNNLGAFVKNKISEIFRQSW